MLTTRYHTRTIYYAEAWCSGEAIHGDDESWTLCMHAWNRDPGPGLWPTVHCTRSALDRPAVGPSTGLNEEKLARCPSATEESVTGWVRTGRRTSARSLSSVRVVGESISQSVQRTWSKNTVGARAIERDALRQPSPKMDDDDDLVFFFVLELAGRPRPARGSHASLTSSAVRKTNVAVACQPAGRRDISIDSCVLLMEQS